MASRLLASVLSGWDRALRASLAADLDREFIAVVLPLIPEGAPEILRLLAGQPGYNELWLLREHAPLLWRVARSEFLARMPAVLPAISPVELLAAIARESGADELPELRRHATAALDGEKDAMRRAQALLDWAPLEPPDRAAVMIAEALDIVRASPPELVQGIIGRFVDQLDAAQRDELRSIALRGGDHGADLLLSIARAAPPAEAIADVQAALKQRANCKPNNIQYALYAALNIVPFDVLRPWLDPWLAALKDRRTLCSAAHRLAPRAPLDVLDTLIERADAIGVQVWARAEILGDVAPHHPTRREELRRQVREAMARVVGDTTLGHRMTHGDVPEGANPVVLQAAAIARASRVLADEAGELQRIVLARIAAMPSDFDDHYDLAAIPWDELGAALDPTLREEAVRAVLALRHRPSALKALGQMVGSFPEHARHLGLHGLSRLADTTPPEITARVLRALSSKSAAPTPPAAKGAADDRAQARWTKADERSLAPLAHYLSSGAHLFSERLAELAWSLTPAASVRAIDLVRGIESPYERLNALLALANAPSLERRAREVVLAEALAIIQADHMAIFHAPKIASMLYEVCAAGDAAWIDRVSAFFDALVAEREPYLDMLEAFAPLLRRLGGPELCAAVAERLRAPLPAPEIARPFQYALRTTFEA